MDSPRSISKGMQSARLFSGRGLPLLLAAAAAIITMAASVFPALAQDDGAVTVVTLNLWHDQQDWPARFELITAELRKLNPDVIVLQEVLQHEDLPNQAVSLAERLGFGEPHFVSVDPEDAAKRYGNAILTRHPVLKTSSRMLAPASDYRTAAHALVEVAGRRISIYSTHLHYSPNRSGADVRKEQIEDLLDFIDETRAGAPVVLAGDFNAEPGAEELERVRARFRDAYAAANYSEHHSDHSPAAEATADTAASTLNPATGHPHARIDYIFAGPELDVLETRVILDEPGPTGVWASDHFGVLARLGTATADFVDDLQERTFRWFWDETPSENGLTPDRAPSRPFSSIAAVGFALPAYAVGVERGYVTREAARDRTLATLDFFWGSRQDTSRAGASGYRGFYYHFLDMDTGERFATNELSTIDTALLIAGVIFAGEYFDRDDPAEVRIRDLADSLYGRIEWDWFQREDGLITMAWRPERGYGPAAYQGYNEAMILYLLALASPSHPVDSTAWDAFTSTYRWEEFYGYPHLNFSPLFGHQYSHIFVDFRGIYDAYMRERAVDYFENSRRATYAQREYGIDNPHGFRDYSGDIWGWTASDGPANTWGVVDGDSVRFHTYWARGVSAGDIRDDGTLVPTAAGGSIAFAPEITIPALKAMRDRYGDLLYNEYGFMDAFNPTYRAEFGEPERGVIDSEHGWFDGDQLGIDQGPIILMLENYRTGLIWDVMRDSKIIVRGLCRAGFSGGWIEGRCESG